MKMQQLREDLDRARSLLDYTRQREKLKLESLKLRIECFEQVCGGFDYLRVLFSADFADPHPVRICTIIRRALVGAVSRMRLLG